MFEKRKDKRVEKNILKSQVNPKWFERFNVKELQVDVKSDSDISELHFTKIINYVEEIEYESEDIFDIESKRVLADRIMTMFNGKKFVAINTSPSGLEIIIVTL